MADAEADVIAVQQESTPMKGDGIEVSRWLDRIMIAKKAAEKWEEESGAKRFIEEYNGNYNSVSFYGHRGQIPVPPINEVFAYVQSDIAATNNRDPYISVNPKTGTVVGAKLWEVALNQEWRKLGTKEEIEFEIIDKDLVGFAWHKVGYHVEAKGSIEENDLEIVDERLYSERVNWRDVVWNISAKRPPKDCQWMAQRIIAPIAEVKKKYPAAAGLEGVPYPDLDDKTFQDALYKDDIKVAVMWEVWDKETRTIYRMAEGLKDRFLEPPTPWPAYQKEFPFLMYWDFVTAGKPRPMSAIAPWEPQILEKIVIMASAVNHVKRWNRQVFVKQGAISGEALDKFERGDDGAIIENNGSGDLDKNMRFVDYGQLPTDFYLLMDRISSIENSINGQPEFQRGAMTKTSTRTIGELELMQSGAKGRTDRKIDRLETHLENIARHMMMHMKGNYDLARLVTLTGDTPEEVIEALGEHYDPVTNSVMFNPREIAGEYDVEVKAGSTLPLDKMTKMKILETVLNTIGNVSPDGVSPLLNAVITELLDGFDVKALTQAYRQEQEQQAQTAEQESEAQSADDMKARTQAAKNFAQSDKIAAETDKIRLETLLNPEGEEQQPEEALF